MNIISKGLKKRKRDKAKMNYDAKRISRLYEKVYNTPPNSPERIAALEKLSESDRTALFDYSNGLLSGRIKIEKTEVSEMEAGTKSYEWYKEKMNSNESGTMKEVSQFAMQCPELYQQYRKRHQQELDRERESRNRKLGESKHKNKINIAR